MSSCGCCCSSSGAKKVQADGYKCSSCGDTSSNAGDCCGKPMKKVSASTLHSTSPGQERMKSKK